VGYHLGLGMWLRNHWGLWSGSPLRDRIARLRAPHDEPFDPTLADADALSGFILSAFAEHLQDPSLTGADLEERERERWRAFWAKVASSERPGDD
jgi:hypothetical protein